VPTATTAATVTATPLAGRSTVIRFSAQLLNADGAPDAAAGLYFVPKVGTSLKESLEKGWENAILRPANEKGGAAAELPAGSGWFVGLTLEGVPTDIAQSLSQNDTSDTITTRFLVPRPFEVRVVLSAPDESKIPNVGLVAEWQVTAAGTGEVVSKRRELTTAPDGSITFGIHRPQTATVRLATETLPAGLLPEVESFSLSEREVPLRRSWRLDFRTVAAISVSGTLLERTTEGKRPRPGATVRVATIPSESVAPREWNPLTAADGTFTIPGLYPRPHILSVREAGFVPLIIEDFHPGKDAQPTLEIGSLPDVVVSLSAPPSLASATVLVSLLSRYDGVRREVPLGGSVAATTTFERVEPGALLLIAEAKGPDGVIHYAEAPVDLSARDASTKTVLALEPLVSLKGKLVEGAPNLDPQRTVIEAIANVGGTVPELAGPHADWRRGPRSTIGVGGNFAVENLVRSRPYLIRVKDSAGNLVGSAEVTGGQSNVPSISLGGLGIVRGRILSARGEACGDQEVRLVVGLGTVEGTAGDMQERTSRTSFDGTYRFENVPAGQARLYLPGDSTSNRLISVSSGRETVIQMQCRRWVRVALDLRIEGTPLKPNEQFLVIPQPGTVVADKVKELTAEQLSVVLEPGAYMLTRTATMESAPFDVGQGLDGSVTVTFKE
jgi:hypothetical protein